MPTKRRRYIPTSFLLVRLRTTSYWERYALIPLVTPKTSFRKVPTDPTNQNESFHCVLSSLARFPTNFLEGHLSQNSAKSSTLNCGVIMVWATRKKMHLVDIGRTIQFL
ncbi:hypothetical protein MtrunA17_Chr2g0314531 [Medicago truncatula]|uniref:Uncharacterized protein n=1 Tax=Medicago truncatula TaxID=3880 RepID=G8A238_MEDTR|nr:hypothetical protein MTR_2g073140 [Medicago truncatula]RHN74827.1 hypothetical protein MtrunA17_Chr2g0314531 [Medicago truncatula]